MSIPHYTKIVTDYLFPGKCYKELVSKFNVAHTKCAHVLFTRVSHISLSAGSGFILLPQMAKIVNSKSTFGISMYAQILALTSFSSIAAHGYLKGQLFSLWGDALFMFIQECLLIMQILYYGDESSYAFAFLAAIWAALLAVVGEYIPLHIIVLIYKVSVPLLAASKLAQVLKTSRIGATGQLSYVSTCLALALECCRFCCRTPSTYLHFGGYVLTVIFILVMIYQFHTLPTSVTSNQKKNQ